MGLVNTVVANLGGYDIPVTLGSGAVPAVSSWGVGVMALLVVGVASVAFRRSRVA